MRLEKIKLAGFKSFVDPTQIPLPGNLVGIVGPNGCGKSNVIDAVRWVMGESSAKHLRGDMMADVIFNGSSARKPVGLASVELLFDNSDGTVTGEYAGYNQISIKRQVTRDGQSTYLLNGTRCRRKDITDLFLGTGLGPRSYAIIEQGTISRLIEAKPEELRTFLEEAAGISKYKERRRDTENRIRRTRENLDRIADLCDELEKQCRHLKRQATIAEKYKDLKQQERLLKSQLLALRWQSFEQQAQHKQQSVKAAHNRVEEIMAQQRTVEKDLDLSRSKYSEFRETWNQVQSEFYAVGSDIAKLEQTLQHRRQTRQQRQQSLQHHQGIVSSAREDMAREARQQQVLLTDQQSLEAELSRAQQHQQQLAVRMQTAETEMNQWQEQWDAFSQQAAEPRRTAEVERTRIGQIEKNIAQMSLRVEHLQREIERLAGLAVDSEIESLSQQVLQLESERDLAQADVQALSEQLVSQRQGLHQLNDQLAQMRSKLSAAQGRLASLEALQQAALGKDQGAVLDWLNHLALSNHPRLAEQLRVDEGWERALEVVLALHLDAVCVDQLVTVLGQMEALPAGELTVLQRAGESNTSPLQGAVPLSSRLQGGFPIDGLLQNIYCVDSLQQARNLQTQLGPQQSVVTRDGVWLGRDWLRIQQLTDEQPGVLAREKDKRALAQSCQELSQSIEELEQQVLTERANLQAAEQRREVLQKQQSDQSRQLSQATIKLNEKKHRSEQAQQRKQQLDQELCELTERQAQEQVELNRSRDTLAAALQRVDEIESQRERLQSERTEKRQSLDAVRVELNRSREQVHAVSLRIESNRSEQALNQRNSEAMAERLAHSEQALQELSKLEAADQQPYEQDKAQLSELLAKRQQVEQQLAAARDAVESIEASIRQLETQRNQVEQQVQTQRDAVSHVQMEHQEIVVRQQTVQEQLDEAGASLQVVLDELPEDATETQWHADVEALSQRIHRLGPINLTAIEEFATQSERKTYLDSQRTDLTESLTTLEQAIAKIDRESRQLFKETFDKVNTGFEKRFPKLFGGGHAYLQLTGEDLLETGVTVMARPPGKRNSSIHLLSGGEKALTAVALVFAIFDLNPAPFCMLDEVDAPLDEANVGRFGQLVREMSEQVQIVLITHNKATMEIANQLAGVTMNEPGVSRLVAVDLDEAAELVAV